MGTEYVFLCGVMWCNYEQEEAGRELAQMTGSSDPDIRALAGAMLTQGTPEPEKSKNEANSARED
jgi:hypothetical protein